MSAQKAMPHRVAAIDLGSNSFHMVIAHLREGAPQVVDRIREQVQLAAGLDERRVLSASAQARAFAVLERFGQRVGGRDDIRIRAVGTNTLRVARNARAFLAEAERRLGCPIEVVSGDEEARLIYLGVAHSVGAPERRRLVVDIGGGSTECIVGRGFDVESTQSVRMGCVSWSKRYFEDGRLTPKAFDRAVLAAERELHQAARALRDQPRDEAVGASGTIRATEEILRQLGGYEGSIERAGLERIRDLLIDAKKVRRAQIRGLKASRAPVYPGGLAVLTALFESLHVERMQVSPGALREGVIYDMLGRIGSGDVRDRTILNFQTRFGVDVAHAAAVEATGLELLRGIAAGWALEDEEAARFLSWSARLHEIGLALSHDRFHRHGAYIVENARMPGFSRDDQAVLASLLLNHRRGLKTDPRPELPRRWAERAVRLAIVLRLATVFHRSRKPVGLGGLRIEAEASKLALLFPAGWLEARPLTRLDLEIERDVLAEVGFELEIAEA